MLVLILPLVAMSHIHVTLTGTPVYSHIDGYVPRLDGLSFDSHHGWRREVGEDGGDRSMWVVPSAVVKDHNERMDVLLAINESQKGFSR